MDSTDLEQGTDIKKQLGNLSSSQWAWALSVFYYPYMFFEPLATLMLKYFSPNVWMSRIMLTWGIISMCQGATQSYPGILACRFFLGAAEAGFYPGVLYHLSFWYPTDRLPLRRAFFYACGMFSGTISGLLAYVISFMNGVAGLAGWRWVCIFRTANHYTVLTIILALYPRGHPSYTVRCVYLLLPAKLSSNSQVLVQG
jgi:MFS family permease